ncbi:MAG: GNAT family N-acetyltransferase [Thermoplasmata archaeon]
MVGAEGLRPAAGTPVDRLMELTHALRVELLARGEFLPSPWVEEAGRDLASGALPGWCALYGDRLVGLAFYSLRDQRAYGHVHMEESPDRLPAAARLVRHLVDELPLDVTRLDVGTTGLPSDEERRLRDEVRSDPSMSVLVRWLVERPLTQDDGPLPRALEGVELRALRKIPIDALTNLDMRAFQGSADESLVSDSFEGDRRVLKQILDGLLGRFLDEASTAALTTEGALIGAVLAGEQSPRTAIILDLMVEPSHRRTGLATFLLRWALRALWALGFTGVRLWVTENNDPARRLYEKLGFHPTTSMSIYRWTRPASSDRSVPPSAGPETKSS